MARFTKHCKLDMRYHLLGCVTSNQKLHSASKSPRNPISIILLTDDSSFARISMIFWNAVKGSPDLEYPLRK